MDFIFDIIAPETLISLMAGLAMTITVYVLWSSLLVRNPMKKRVALIAKRRQTLQSDIAATQSHYVKRVFDTQTLMQRVVQNLALLKSQQAERIALELSRAGWRTRESLITYLFMKAVLPMAFGISAMVLLTLTPILDVSLLTKLFTATIAACLGYYAPEIFVKNAVQKRYHAILQALPDTLDLLVICAEAGLSLDAALTRVAQEMGKSSPELADEFALCAVELGFLPKRRDALTNLMARCDLPSIRGVVGTLVQTEKYGTPLAQSLRVLSAEFRADRMMRAEEKAARLPATLTIPLIVFILPSLFVVLLGPAILQAIDGLGGL